MRREKITRESVNKRENELKERRTTAPAHAARGQGAHGQRPGRVLAAGTRS